MTQMHYKEFFPVSQWEIIDTKTFYDWNEQPHLAVCVKVGELIAYEVNQLGTCPKHYARLHWMPFNTYKNYTQKDDLIIW